MFFDTMIPLWISKMLPKLHHRTCFVSVVANRFCTRPSQECDRPWKLPADAPNSFHLVNRSLLPDPAHALLDRTTCVTKYTTKYL